MDFGKLLLEYLECGKKDQEIPEALLETEFVFFFLNYIHTVAATLCEQKTNVSPVTKQLPQEISDNSQHKRLSNKKNTSKERVSTPKQRKDVLAQSPLGQAKNAETGTRRNRRSRGKSPLVKQGEPDVHKRQFSKTDSQPRRVTLTQVTEKCSAPRFDLKNSNEFPSLGSESPFAIQPILSDHKQVSRRIKPTLVTKRTSERCQLFTTQGQTTQSNVVFGDNNVKLDLQREREKLLQTRIFSVAKVTPAEVKTLQIEDALDKQLQFISPIKLEDEGPAQQSPTQSLKVVYENQIKRLADLYTHYIKSSLVTSIVAEIHLLVALLVLDGNAECELPQDLKALQKYLCSLRNSRQFAANCLCGLAGQSLFSLFSNETLSLLQANTNTKAEFTILCEHVNNEMSRREKWKLQYNTSMSFTNLGSVPFKVETDDKTSFTSEKAFHGFRKQRDMFYSLMREWRESHDLNASSAPKETVGKIRWLVTQVRELSTYSAFLRLFVDHLLSVGTEKEGCELNDLNNSTLYNILGNDPEKRRRLESRVSKPSQPNTSHEWLFKDFQFFRDFLTIGDNYSLNIRLCDILSDRISDIEKQNCLVDENSVENGNGESLRVSQTIMGLRICGNFYGYITFLPYKKDNTRHRISHIESSALAFVLTAIKRAQNNGHMFLTVPWVVQFFCFLPNALLEKDEVQCPLQILHSVPRHRNAPLTRFQLFLSVVVGYLFEQDCVSGEDWCGKMKVRAEPIEVSSNSVDKFADSLMTHELLYDMHWKLNDINNLLKSRSSSLSSRQLPKKIKPSTEKLPEQQNLQATLEANFFRNQSLSLKRTVTFVAERCHSNCIKHVCTSLLPNYCKNSPTIQRLLPEIEVDKKAINLVVVKVIEDASKTITQQAIEFNSNNIEQCMQLLVSSTVPKQVLETATKIAERQSSEMICGWLKERLFELLASKIKQNTTKQMNLVVAHHQAKFSVILHELRELIIKNQEADLENHLSIFENSINYIKSTSGVLDEFYEALPSNIKQSISFLMCQILMQLTKSAYAELKEKLNSLPFTASEKNILFKCLSD